MSATRAIVDPIRYGFAVGRVRVLETRMLPPSTYERLLDARDFAERRRILGETIYGGYLERAHHTEGIERGLEAAIADLYAEFLGRANLPEPLVAYFRTRHDFENLKGRLKAEALGIEPGELFTRLGATPVEVFSGPAEGLPPLLRAAERRIRAAIEVADGPLDVERVDEAVDAELYAALADIVARAKSPFLATLFALEADLGNARAFIRGRARNVPVARMEGRFVPGGRIPRARLVSLYRLPLAEAAARLAATGSLRGVDPEALTDLERFDVAADVHRARLVRTSRLIAIGPEPVLGYVMERLAEVTALRTLLIGALAGVPREVLRARLEDVM